jgi:hypothetical protein
LRGGDAGMMMAPSGDMIVKSRMMVNWTNASSATSIDWYRENPPVRSCLLMGATMVWSVMKLVRKSERRTVRRMPRASLQRIGKWAAAITRWRREAEAFKRQKRAIACRSW